MHFELALRHRIGALDLDVALEGGPGVTALFGPSGAGKTTVLRALAGLLRPDAGAARLGDRVLFDTRSRAHIPPHRRRMGLVFQDGRLFPHLSVAQNLDFGARYAPPGAGVMDRDAVIALLGLAGLLDRRPGTLSGGETQRVTLGRALLSAPDMLLMDEPLAALDGPRKDEILPYLERLKSRAAIPILYITHSVDELARLADQVALMDNGRILRAGPVFEVLAAPEAIPLLGLHEAGAVLEADVSGPAVDGLTPLSTAAGSLELPGIATPQGTRMRLRILARDVILATERPTAISARNILPGRITRIEPGRGPGVAVVVQLGDQPLLARITEASRRDLGLREGSTVFAILKATAVARGKIQPAPGEA